MAIWTTSVVTVTTNPVSAAVAPTIAASTAVAVEAEYWNSAETWTRLSIRMSTEPSTAPSTAPASGSTQRESLTYRRARKTLRQLMAERRPVSSAHIAAYRSTHGQQLGVGAALERSAVVEHDHLVDGLAARPACG